MVHGLFVGILEVARNGPWADITGVLLSPQLKLKNMVTTQQEKLIGEKDLTLERHKHELETQKESLSRKDEEVCTSIVHVLLCVAHSPNLIIISIVIFCLTLLYPV